MIQLFKAGTSHIYKGVTCEMQTISEFGFEGLLAENGGEWYLTPEACYPEEKKVIPKVIPKVVPKETIAGAIEEAVEEVKEAAEAIEKVKDLQEKKFKKEEKKK